MNNIKINTFWAIIGILAFAMSLFLLEYTTPVVSALLLLSSMQSFVIGGLLELK